MYMFRWAALRARALAGAHIPRAAAAAAAATTGFVLVDQQLLHPPAAAAAGGTTLIMSGDCGGTNTRLQAFRVPVGSKASPGKTPEHELVFSKKYLNSSYGSFEEVMKVFLAELKQTPVACCLACAGGITNNTVTFTNVDKGWNIDGYALQKSLGISSVKLTETGLSASSWTASSEPSYFGHYALGR